MPHPNLPDPIGPPDDPLADPLLPYIAMLDEPDEDQDGHVDWVLQVELRDEERSLEEYKEPNRDSNPTEETVDDPVEEMDLSEDTPAPTVPPVLLTPANNFPYADKRNKSPDPATVGMSVEEARQYNIDLMTKRYNDKVA